MPIYIHCDICKRVMGETTIEKLKRFRKVYGERCSQCQRILDHVDNHTKKLKRAQNKKMDVFFAETKENVIHEIQMASLMPPKKPSFWNRFKYLLAGGQRVAVQEPLPKDEEPDERLRSVKVQGER